MRRTVVLAAAAAVLSGCLGATSSQRRNRGAACIATGAALIVLGAYLSHKGQEAEGLDGLPEGLAGVAFLASGMVTVGVGGANVLSGFAAEIERQPSTPPALQADDTACVTWQANRDQEPDPARRAALDAARPAHCRARAAAAR